MKLSASILNGVPKQAAISKYASQVFATADIGHLISTAGGETYRIVARASTPAGERIRVASRAGVETFGAAEFAELRVVSPAMIRFASSVFRMLALNSIVGQIVNAAVEEAGYSSDPAMNWTGWLNRVFFSDSRIQRLNVDPDVVDENIIDMLTHELIDKAVIKKNFKPEHASWAHLPMERRVSAFLCKLFKFRVGRVVEAIQKEQGAGLAGDAGRVKTVSLSQGGDEDEDRNEVFHDTGVENQDIADMESEDEIAHFVDEFKIYLKKKQSPLSYKVCVLLTNGVLANDSFDEIFASFATAGLKDKSGQPIPYQSFSHIRREWRKRLIEFVTDPAYGFEDSDLAIMILRRIKELEKEEKQKNPAKTAPEPIKASVLLSALRTADAYEQNSPTPVQGGPTPPPISSPTNPNVAQQDAAKAQSGMAPSPQAAPPANESGFQAPVDPMAANPAAAHPTTVNPAAAPNPSAPPPKSTIAPEIPGLNHNASLEDTMSKAATASEAKRHGLRVATTKKVDRFARLRQVAAEEAPQLEAALEEFGAAVREFADTFPDLKNNLDLASPEKTASLKVKVQSRRKYAAKLRQIAAEEPEQLEQVMQESYEELDNLLSAFENLSEHLGIELKEPGAEAFESIEEESIEPAGDEPIEDEDETGDDFPTDDE